MEEYPEEEKNLLTNTGGVYGRGKVARKSTNICDVCSERKDVLSFDSSDGEYSLISICKECFNKLLV